MPHPLARPNMNLNIFADDIDIIVMCEGIMFSYNVLTKDIFVDKYPWDMPLDSDEEMKITVLDCCQTAFHPCGINRLSKNIKKGVADCN